MSQKNALWDNNSGSHSLQGSSARCAGLDDDDSVLAILWQLMWSYFPQVLPDHALLALHPIGYLCLYPQTSTSSSPDSSVTQLSSIFRNSVAMASTCLLSDNCWFRQISLRINCFCCSLTLSHQFHCFLFQEFCFFSRGLFLQVGAVSTLAVLRLAIQSNRPEN